MEEQKKKKFRFRFPLWAKTLIVLVLSVSLVSIVAVVFSTNVLQDITRSHYIEHSIELADTLGMYLNLDDTKAVKNKVDTIYKGLSEEQKVENSYWGEPEWETYLQNYNEVVTMPEYTRLFNQIHEFHSKNDVRYTYLAYADFTNYRLIYLVDDSPKEERCLPGSFDDFTESDMTIFDHLESGFTPEITNTPEYGYLASVGRPIFDGTTHNMETLVAFSLVDLSMDDIVAKENEGIRTLSFLLAGLGAGAVIISYILVLILLVRPVRKLTKVANEYVEGGDENLNKFSKIKINTADEIEDLSNSMKKMEEDLNRYITDLLSTSTKLEGAEKQAIEMKHLAVVDALTNVGNKLAYFETEERLNVLINENNAKFAICMIDLNDLKLTNDTMGHETGDDLIVELSNIIKNVFVNSTIYRIGGDEFAVVIEGEEVKSLKKLENQFIALIQESINKGGDIIVSAAIGSATFNPNIDNNVEDTFKRADTRMYESKKKMKK